MRTKLPTVPQVSPYAEVVQKDREAKARIKAYADLKRQTKPLRLNIGDHALVKQRTQNKASPRFEPVVLRSVHNPRCPRFYDHRQESN